MGVVGSLGWGFWAAQPVEISKNGLPATYLKGGLGGKRALFLVSSWCGVAVAESPDIDGEFRALWAIFGIRHHHGLGITSSATTADDAAPDPGRLHCRCDRRVQCSSWEGKKKKSLIEAPRLESFLPTRT